MQSEKSSVLCCASSTLFVFVSCTLTIVARLLEASLVLYRARANSNPYKMVFKVLNFVRRHKHPLRCSAFTYCGAEDLDLILPRRDMEDLSPRNKLKM